MYKVVDIATDKVVEIGYYSELVEIYLGELLGGMYEIEEVA
jgi:hypothetical protein